MLDNEISKEYKAAIKANGATHKLVPPGEHCCNIANKSIQTYKNNFVGVLAGFHKSFPMHRWVRLLPQAEVIKYLTKIFHHSQDISLCTCPHPPPFYAKSTSPFGVPCIGTRKARQKSKLVRPCDLCMEFGHIDGTPLGIQRVQQTDDR